MSVRLFRFTSILVTISLLLFLSACGGGTTGSDGGGDLRIAGVVRDSSGATLAKTIVTLEETGDSAESDHEGRFLLVSSAVPSGHLLLDGVNASVSFNARTESLDLTNPEALLNLEITITVESGQAEVKDLSIVPVTPAPSVTQTPHQLAPSTLSGSIFFEDGSPAVGARVTISEFAKTDRSDTFGDFSLSFPSGHDQLNLTVALKRASTRIRLSGLPQAAVEIRIRIRLLVNEIQVATESGNSLEKQVKYTVVEK